MEDNKINISYRNDEREKVKLTANILFSGIGCQERGFENSGLPDDIEKPIESESNWIPAKKGCGQFRWS